MKNRIDQLFESGKTDVLTIYFTAGYPNLNDTETVLLELDRQGVDLIEIGMPYSDPLADGPTIQKSSSRALENGMTLDILFDQLDGIRTKTQIPLVLMGYYNQLLQYGLETFCKRANEVGIDGLILPDLPLYEYESTCKAVFEKYGLTSTFLVTPSSSDERIRTIDNASSGFLYAVSSHSITGGSVEADFEAYGKRLSALKLKNPIQVGFGIGNASAYDAANNAFDGAIIGSAFIKAISEPGSLTDNIAHFIQSIKSKTPQSQTS